MRTTIPIHLETEDKLYGLTTRQVVVLALSLTTAYAFWSSVPLPVAEVLVAAIPIILGCLVAFLQPSGTSLDEWFLIWVFFSIMPKVYLWEMLPADQDFFAEDSEEGTDRYDEEEEYAQEAALAYLP